jgi:hypothetical protein
VISATADMIKNLQKKFLGVKEGRSPKERKLQSYTNIPRHASPIYVVKKKSLKLPRGRLDKMNPKRT